MPIVTPNWNLPTPALTDAYNLVGDLATFSTAVDGAITSVANAQKGTAAQRIAAAAATPDGVLWQDTDGIKMIWKRDGSVAGQWAPAVARWIGTTAQMNAFTQAPNGFEWFNNSDSILYTRLEGVWQPEKTDWIALGGWTGGFAPAASPVSYRRVGDIIEFRGSITNSSWSGPLTSFGGTIPLGYRPVQTGLYNMPANSTISRVVEIAPTGVVRLYGSVASGSWWSFDQVRFQKA